MTNLAIIVPVNNIDVFKNNILHALKSTQLQECAKIVVFDSPNSLNEEKEVIDLLRLIPNLDLTFLNVANVGQARNHGIAKAIIKQAEYVAFWDADDNVNVMNFIESLLMLKKSGKDILISNYVKYDLKNGTSKLIGNKTSVNDWNFYIEGIGLWRMIFRIDLLTSTIFPANSMGEDLAAFAKINKYNRKVFYVNKNYYQYNVGLSSQLTSMKTTTADLFSSGQFILHNMIFEGVNLIKINCLSRILVSVLANLEFEKKLLFVISILKTPLPINAKLKVLAGAVKMAMNRKLLT